MLWQNWRFDLFLDVDVVRMNISLLCLETHWSHYILVILPSQRSLYESLIFSGQDLWTFWTHVINWKYIRHLFTLDMWHF